MPGKSRPEPQMLWLEITASTGRRWLHAAAHLICGRRCRLGASRLRAWKRRERGSCCCRDVFSQLHVVLTPGCCPSFRGRWGEVRFLCAFTSNRTLQSLPHLVVGQRGLGLTSGQVSFPPPCSSSPCPCLFSAPMFNKAVYSSPNF